MRRRTNKKQEQQQPESMDATPLDEDEQEQIVQALEESVSQQQQQINKVFSFVCLLLAAASIGVSFLEATTSDGWKHVFAHAVYAAILHIVAARNATQITASEMLNDYLLSLVPVVIPLFPLYLWSDGFDHGMEPHVALAVGNAFTTTCSAMLRRDASSTLRSLEELESSKYRYKSL